MLWDRGLWYHLDDPEEGLEKGRLRFALEGERLTGEGTLARMKGDKGERENWLLMKRKDSAAEDIDPAARWRYSVATGRNLKEIAENGQTLAESGLAQNGNAEPSRFVKPMLATLVESPPSGELWLHEIKHDGYRLITVIAKGRATLYTRSGHDWTDRFSGLAEGFEALGIRDAVIDGEAVAAGQHGTPDFSALQKAMSAGDQVQAVVFDLLHHDGDDLRDRPLEARRERLRELIGDTSGAVRFGDSIAADGAQVLARACDLGAEGVVSKRAAGRYRSGRSKGWLKSKCEQRAEAVIGGYRLSDKRGRPFASLLLGTYEDGRLIYRGRVGTGFDERAFNHLGPALARRRRKTPPFDDLPAAAKRGAVWVTPDLVAQLRYTEITADGAFRHPSFLGLREDKPAKEVKAERLSQPAPAITNRDKVLYPDAGATKGDLADYLDAVAEQMLPWCAGRPLTLVRCPGGREACFFQKRPGRGLLDAIRVWQRDGSGWMAADDRARLLACAQLGALELHIGGAIVKDPERPEQLVFDLDPGPGVAFDAVKWAARETADILRAAGLEPFLMLTGGKGIHVVAPLTPKANWDGTRRFARAVAHAMAKADPDRYVAKASKAARQGRIFLDWMHKGDGQTAIAPYSPRARQGAPVAAPLDWASLSRISAADRYDLNAMRRRLAMMSSDVWYEYEAARRAPDPERANRL
jgi:bifunctional non-homologous end joining protein LigD